MRHETFSEKGLIDKLNHREFNKALQLLNSEFVHKTSPCSHSWLGEFIKAGAPSERLVNLIETFPNLTTQEDTKGHSPLFFAAKKQDINAIKLLKKYGVDINSAFGDHGTCLHIASRKNNPKFILELINEGVDHNALNLHGERADDIARRWSCYENVELFDKFRENPQYINNLHNAEEEPENSLGF